VVGLALPILDVALAIVLFIALSLASAMGPVKGWEGVCPELRSFVPAVTGPAAFLDSPPVALATWSIDEW
jgi:hypothetical protein